jgi:hypothetical protein
VRCQARPEGSVKADCQLARRGSDGCGCADTGGQAAVEGPQRGRRLAHVDGGDAKNVGGTGRGAAGGRPPALPPGNLVAWRQSPPRGARRCRRPLGPVRAACAAERQRRRRTPAVPLTQSGSHPLQYRFPPGPLGCSGLARLVPRRRQGLQRCRTVRCQGGTGGVALCVTGLALGLGAGVALQGGSSRQPGRATGRPRQGLAHGGPRRLTAHSALGGQRRGGLLAGDAGADEPPSRDARAIGPHGMPRQGQGPQRFWPGLEVRGRRFPPARAVTPGCAAGRPGGCRGAAPPQ